MAALRAYVGRSQRAVERATVHLSKDHHNDIIKHIISRCRILQRLDIVSGWAGSTLLRAAPLAIELKTLALWDCEVSLASMCQLLVDCSNLEQAEFHNVHCFDHKATWRGNMSKIRSLLINVTPGKAHGCDLVSKSSSESYNTIN